MKQSVLLGLLLIPVILSAQLPGDRSGRYLLPNGWWLSPAGEQVPLGDLPLNAALSPDERYLAVSHSGQSKAELRLVDLKEKKEVQRIRMKDTWLGIRFIGSMLYVSGGYENCVYRFRLAEGQLALVDSLPLAEARPKYNGAMEGLDVRGTSVACVFKQDSTLRFIDTQSRATTVIKLEGMPYDCRYLPNGSVIVSLWSSRKVVVYDAGKKSFECATGDHPTELTVSQDGRYVFVPCANDNTVNVIDLEARKTSGSAGAAIHPDAPEGSTTNSVAEVPGKKLLLAANADNNSLTVIDIRDPQHPTPVGFIPVGWYPTKVLVRADGTVLVLNGKGGRSFANPRRQYIASLMEGSLSIFPMPDEKTLAGMSKQVLANTPYRQTQMTSADVPAHGPVPASVGAPSPIKHVFYIIKENRTYDQVFGDMPQGNGDTSLCLFGEIGRAHV
jgi:hypothetical protein